MNNFTTIVSILFILIVFSACQDRQEKRPILLALGMESEENDKAQSIEDRFQQEFDMTHDPFLQVIPTERLVPAKKWLDRRFKSRAPIPFIDWQERGPWNVGGRTRAIMIDQNDPTNNTVFAGGVNGGIWKTTNFRDPSPEWTAIDDFFDNIAVSSMVQDTANLNKMYFGTGEGWFNGDAARGLGIWTSTDGGTTWNQLSATNNSDFHYVQDLLIDGNGALYAATRNEGVQRSTDGGATWTQVLGNDVGTGATNRAADLELAANGDIYASLGIFSSGSIWRSDASNGNNTGDDGYWTEITPSGGFRRIELACAPSDANRVYALCHASNNNDVEAIFRTNNSGSNWSSLPIPNIIDQGRNSTFTRSQAWYDLIAAVDPNNEDVVYIGGVDALRSTDGGDTWEQITTWSLFNAPGFGEAQNVHADHHQIVFLPDSSSSAIWGTDGGLHFTEDLDEFSQLPTFVSKNTGYNVTQFYTCAIHPDSGSYYALAGSQDNGTQQFRVGGLNYTREPVGGDGAQCFIDQDDPNIQIASYVRSNYYVSTDSGASFSRVRNDGSGRFINPADYDDPENILYFSYDAGKFGRIKNIGGSETFNSISVVEFNGGQVSSVAVDPNTDNRVWFGVGRYWNGSNYDGEASLFKVDNAHLANPTVTDVSVAVPADVPASAFLSSIAIQEGDPDHLVITFSNYGVTSIWETTNGGTSWQSAEGNLPDIPVRSVVFDPADSTGIFLGTDLGVWSTTQLQGSSTQWDPTNVNLANTRVDMLQYRTSDQVIAAATHGRGLFTARTTGQGYCVPEHRASENETITRVELATLDNNTGGWSGDVVGYADYSDLRTVLTKDSACTITVTPNYSFSDSKLAVWIDWDHDYFFEAEERVVNLSGNGPWSADIIPPSNAYEGAVRMRVRLLYGPDLDPHPCERSGYNGGETEDYTVVISEGVPMQIKANLEGTYDSGLDENRDNLRSSGHLPLTEPYTTFGFTKVNNPVQEQIADSAAVLSVTGSDAIVDWIFLELRDPTDPTTVLSTRSALLQRDGDVVDVDGTSAVTFGGLTGIAEVYVVIRHRNHFGVRTGNLFTLDPCSPALVDFTDTSLPVYGTNARKQVGSKMVLIAGDANRDGQVNAVDRNAEWRPQNGQMYDYHTSTADFNCDGIVNAVDKNTYWRVNNSFVEQLD